MMRSTKYPRTAAVVVAVALATLPTLSGCGGDDGGSAACGVEGCGGDPVGTWSIVDSCVAVSDFAIPNCAEAELTSFNFSNSGTVTINADNTYTTSVTTSGNLRISIPGSCLMGLVMSCSDLDDDGQTCTGDVASECDCLSDIDDTDTESGDWSVSGTSITLDNGVDSPDTLAFCVTGDSMGVKAPDEDGVSVELLLER